jgi:hypothetical protein
LPPVGRAAPRPPRPMPILPWARAYGLTLDPGSGPRSVSLIGPGPGFDPGYAMTTDLDDPVIIASVTVPGEPPALLIDGCHRLYKAARLGREHLPSLVLTRRRPCPSAARQSSRPATAPPGGKPAEGRPSHDYDHRHDLAQRRPRPGRPAYRHAGGLPARRSASSPTRPTPPGACPRRSRKRRSAPSAMTTPATPTARTWPAAITSASCGRCPSPESHRVAAGRVAFTVAPCGPSRRVAQIVV